MFILLTRKKATETLTHKENNYQNRLRRCQDIAVRLKFNGDMIEI